MQFTGKSVAEAIKKGLESLGVTEEQAKITVISEEEKGWFGKIKKEAVVEVESALTDGERAAKFLDGLFEKINVTAKTELKEEGENISINVITTSSASIIGYRGEVLDALQNLAGAVANIGNEKYKRVVVDCEEYRAKREETLINLANKLADKAVRQGRDVSLEPMNPYERRIIHSTLASSEKVTTTSEGKEPNRRVVIIPNEKKPYEKKNSDKKNFKGKGDRGGKKSFGEKPERKKPSTFGTYLGNSLKN